MTEEPRLPRPMWGEDDDGVEGFMCLTDFECEIGAAMGGTVVYPSEDDLRRSRRCVDECGIVKVKVVAVELIQDQTRFPDEEEDQSK